MLSDDVIHYRNFCRDTLSKLCSAADNTYTEKLGNSTERIAFSNWLISLCNFLSSMEQHDTWEVSNSDKKDILHDALLRQHGLHLRVVVRYFVLKSFKAKKSRRAVFGEEITLIKQFGFADIYRNDILAMLYDEMECYISKKLRGEYEDPVLPVIEEWISSTVITFCARIFSPRSTSESLRENFQSKSQLALARARAGELFDMVRDFPESTPAVLELRQASHASGTTSFLGKTLKRALCGRLLHLGASTSDIIAVYVKMIRCFRILDPSNLLLNFVAKPIRRYLVSRKDTIRCIVSSLTEGDDDNLHGELRAGGSLEYGAGNHDNSDDEEDEEDAAPDLHWVPAKRAVDFPGGRGGGQRDVLALLVSIYGSTDLFVTEYRSILAARLLQNIEYFSDVEVKTLELLKIR